MLAERSMQNTKLLPWSSMSKYLIFRALTGTPRVARPVSQRAFAKAAAASVPLRAQAAARFAREKALAARSTRPSAAGIRPPAGDRHARLDAGRCASAPFRRTCLRPTSSGRPLLGRRLASRSIRPAGRCRSWRSIRCHHRPARDSLACQAAANATQSTRCSTSDASHEGTAQRCRTLVVSSLVRPLGMMC